MNQKKITIIFFSFCTLCAFVSMIALTYFGKTMLGAVFAIVTYLDLMIVFKKIKALKTDRP